MKKKSIIEKLQKAKYVLLATHVNPDPDGLCSILVLGMVLKQWGVKYSIVTHEKVSGRYDFIPTIKSIKPYKETMKANFDCAVICDCGDMTRLGKVSKLINKDTQVLNIDHHVTNTNFGLINAVKPKASSTVEVVYELLFSAPVIFTKNMAMMLYTGIVSDTGSFRFDNTGFRTHQIVAELMQFDFSASKIYQKLYDNISLNDAGEFLKVANQYECHFKKVVLSLVLRKSTLKRFSDQFDLRDSLFKFLCSIQGVEAVAIFTEHGKEETRVNLRSTGKVNVAVLANYFSGGGHKKASGCMIEKTLLQAKATMLKEIRKVV